VGIIGFILMIVGIIKALGAIKRVNFQLNNVNLSEWRSKYILSIVIVIIGGIIGFVAMFGLMSSLSGSSNPNAIIGVIIGWLVFIFILLIISGVLEMKAWENMRIFFEQNKHLFPEITASDAIEASKNLRTAALMRALIFLIITGIIGFIFELIGYFKMAHLKNLGLVGGKQPSASVTQPGPTPTAAATPGKRFCPNCGSPITGTEKFCSSCGSEI
jgi:hypothetical protein